MVNIPPMRDVVAEGAHRPFHRDTIRRHRHDLRHPPHIHAGVAHGHIARQERTHLLVQIPGLHPHHVRKLVAHLVHDVVRHMAVEGPVAGRIGDKLDSARLPDRDQHGRFRPLRRQGDILAVGRGDAEVIPVDVDRVVVHGAQVAQTDAHLIAGFAHQRASRRKDFAVHRQDVEIRHFQGVGAGRARFDGPFAEHNRKVPVHMIFRRRVARMDDKHADQAHAHLRHLVVMGVEHEGPVLP